MPCLESRKGGSGLHQRSHYGCLADCLYIMLSDFGIFMYVLGRVGKYAAQTTP
jgi:hypothetical protein